MDDSVQATERGEEERVELTLSTSVERVIVSFTVEEMADSRAARVL